ncbi:ATP-dependent DNA ligase [Pseudacidobacterium ailaaui]|jgi:DNA ligase-1|uniref:ATP-dependent DNA ligase n=1 Tax=Pseudacidobacterium ailaaui TaxID=1382359 RepID=UPI00047C36CC|nr:ATP-dependent DNA ligase [Pseudacidobacterium ailaaui]
MSASFLQFARLCQSLASTSRKLEKRDLMVDSLRQLSARDAGRTALYLSGRPFAEADSRTLQVGGSLLSKALAELTGADPETLSAAYRRHGDLGAAAEELLANSRKPPCAQALTMEELEQSFAQIASASGTASRMRLLLDLLGRATPLEAKYLIKLVTGDMRIGVKQSLVEEAIARAYNADLSQVRRALMLTGDLAEVTVRAISGTVDQARMRLFHPLGFMLASPVATVEEALERFTEEVRAEHGGHQTRPTEAIREAQVEDKYDGIRAQLHCGDPGQPGRVALFSRNREDISESFPELVEAFAQITEPVILDGEIVAWNPAGNRALPFTSLQQRLGRKRVAQELRERVPVVWIAFDLLSLGGELLLERPLRERRQALETLVKRLAPATSHVRPQGQAALFEAPPAPCPRLLLAPAMQLESAEQLERAYTQARERGNEGIMIKDRNSAYQPGRRGLAWLKLKRELATLDVVVTAAEYGHGRRAGVLSDYTFAVRDGDRLKNIGKAYSGLTDAEIEQLSHFFKAHTLEDHGHFRTVEPLVVLEVAFNNIMRSDRHDSGFALRFPRILRIRNDKPVQEIDTLQRVEELYHAQPDKALEQSQ